METNSELSTRKVNEKLDYVFDTSLIGSKKLLAIQN